MYAAMALVALLALSHGYVHALELTANGDALSYCVGFLASTALLHGLGIGFGLISKNYLKLVSASFALICTAVGLSLLAGV
jgi:urease accessory protein